MRLNLGFAAIVALLAAPAFAPTASAQTSRCCQEDCAMTPAGKISEVFTDPAPTETCAGDLGNDVPAGRLKGQTAMLMENGKLFIPSLGIAVDMLDAEADGSVTLTTSCEELAVYGAANTAAGMGHGGCQ